MEGIKLKVEKLNNRVLKTERLKYDTRVDSWEDCWSYI